MKTIWPLARRTALTVLGVGFPLFGCDPEPEPTPDPEGDGFCDDGIDNDGDGLTDCADSGCAGAAACRNSAPVAVDDAFSTLLDEPLVFTVADLLANDSDPDGDTLTVVSFTDPNSGLVTREGDDLTFYPDPGMTGAATFTYTISDGALTATANVLITVGDRGDPPLANDDTISAREDDTITYLTNDLLANDSDPDGDAIVFVRVENTVNVDVTVEGNVMTLVLEPNFFGLATFDYVITDGFFESVATVSINVAAVNDPPTVSNVVVTTGAGVPILLTLTGADIEGETLDFVLTGGPFQGELSLVERLSSTSVRYSYTPDAGFVGRDYFGFKANDGTDDSLLGLAEIFVVLGPLPPVAEDDTITIDENTTASIPAADLLENDADPNGDTLTIAAVSEAVNGTVSLSAQAQVVTFIPSPDFFGAASFRYTISDGNGGVDSALVSVTVRSVNDRPIAVDDAFETLQDEPVMFTIADLLANDSDPEGDALTFVSFTDPNSGLVTREGDDLTFYPDPGMTGAATFTYTISDGALTATGNVLITVGDRGDPPLANDDTINAREDDTITYLTNDLLANDSDPDGDAIVFVRVENTVNVDVTLNGNVMTLVLEPDFFGVATFDYVITDGFFESVATVSINIAPVNDPPTVTNVAVTTNSRTPVDLVLNGNDVEGAMLDFFTTGGPFFGELVYIERLSATQLRYLYTPDTGFVGRDYFGFKANDGDEDSLLGLAEIFVVFANTPPVATDDTLAATEDTQLILDASSLLANDTDVDTGDLLSITSLGNFDGLIATLTGQTLTLTPALHRSGPASFTYTVADENGGTDVGLVTVNIAAVADPPTLAVTDIVGSEDTAIPLPLDAALVDTDGSEVLTVTIDGLPPGAVLSAGRKVGGTFDGFETPSNYPTGLQPQGLVALDFNRDGVADIAAVTFSANYLARFEGKGDGTFSVLPTLSSGITPQALVAGRFNADQEPDILVSSSFGTRLRRFIGGNGTFTLSGTFLDEESPGLGQLASGDFNSDGFTDAAVVQGLSNLIIMVHDGINGFTRTQTLSLVSPSQFGRITVARLNGDNHDDIVFSTGNNIGVALGVGDGTFGAITSYSTSPGVGPSSVAVGFINDDDFPDLVVPNNSSGNVGILLGAGDGTFGSATVFSTGGTNPRNAVIADFDGDGHNDLVVANFFSDNLSVLLGRGDGTFKTATLVAGSDGAVGMVVGHFDTDPYLDVATSNFSGGNVSVFLNRGTHSRWEVPQDALSNLTMTPPANYSGQLALTVTATATELANGDDATTSDTLTLTILDVNDAPTLDPIADLQVALNAATSLELTGIRPAGPSVRDEFDQELTVTARSSNPAFVPNPTLVFDAFGDATLSFTPALNLSGGVRIQVTVQDDGGVERGGIDTTSRSFVVCVGPDPCVVPVCGDGRIEGNELCDDGNEDDGDGCDWACRDEAGFFCEGQPSVCDAWPLAVDDVATVLEDGGPVVIDVLANDARLNNTPLTVTITSPPAFGVAVVNADKTITYTPDADENDSDGFTYRVVDADGDGSSGRVDLVFIPVNDPPVFLPIADREVDEDPLSAGIDVSFIVRPGPLTSLELAQDFTVTLSSDNPAVVPHPVMVDDVGQGRTLRFVPLSPGTATITITAQDDGGTELGGVDTASGTFEIVVRSVCGDGVVAAFEECDDGNEAVGDGCDDRCDEEVGFACSGEPSVCDARPVAVDDTVSILEDSGPVIIDVLENDLRLVDGPFEVTLLFQPPRGEATVNPDNTISYTPDPDEDETDQILYRVRDADGDSDVGTVTVVMTPVNDPPIFGLVNSREVDEDPTGGGVEWFFWLDPGPSTPIENAQTMTVTIVSHHPLVVSDIELLGDTGRTRRYRFVPRAPGVATISITARDNGGIAFGGNDSAAAHFQITVRSVCGDGVVADFEGCDDGNTLDGDGCDSDCEIEDGFVCSGEPSVCRVKAPCALSDYLGAHAVALDPDTGNCFVSFYDPVPWLAAQTECEALGGYLAVAESESDNALMAALQPTSTKSWVGVSDFGNTSLADPARFTRVTGGLAGFSRFGAGEPSGSGATGCVRLGEGVETWQSADCGDDLGTGSYVREIEGLSCGDGVRQASRFEACDDGNRRDGDGCDADCQIEAPVTCVPVNPATGVDNLSCFAPVVDCVAGNTALDLGAASCVGMASPDMVSAQVVSDVIAGSREVNVSSSAGFYDGDDVLLIAVQGAAAGRYLVTTVESITGALITLSDAPEDTFVTEGARVVLQRIARFEEVVVGAEGSLTAGAWDGTAGGIFALVADTVVVHGAIDMGGRGFRGGARPELVSERGFNGEGVWVDRTGARLLSTGDAGGGAGGGALDAALCGTTLGTPGNGGGGSVAGTRNNAALCSAPGSAITDLSGMLPFMGGGGGSGGNSDAMDEDPRGGAGGSGGGIVYLVSQTLDIGPHGAIWANGEAGQGDLVAGCSGIQTNGCWDRAGPGGGGGRRDHPLVGRRATEPGHPRCARRARRTWRQGRRPGGRRHGRCGRCRAGDRRAVTWPRASRMR